MKKVVFIFFVLLTEFCLAQTDTLPFNRKEEIVFDSKRYRKYNNYLTFGGGLLYSSVRNIDQRVVAADFQFHLQKQYFQLGFLMSGRNFLDNNNLQAHVCFGKRIEKEKMNLALFVGPSYSKFVTAKQDTSGAFFPVVTTGMGGYVCLQAIYKVKYDVGIGIELFGDFTAKQQMGGAKLIVFFSGAYRGVKRGFKTKPKPKTP